MHDSVRLPWPSRRTFLAGSAALLTTATLLRDLLAQAGSDPAFPRGKRRDLLAAACPPGRLKTSLIPLGTYRPFPTIEDRGAWEKVRSETRAAFVASGEKFLKYAWPEMPATVFLEYARIGNRSDYEKLRNARMGALQALVFAAGKAMQAAGARPPPILPSIAGAAAQAVSRSQACPTPPLTHPYPSAFGA